MKYLIIIATLLLLNCADNITNKHYGDSDAKTWCSVDTWSNGDFREMYTLEPVIAYEDKHTNVIEVQIDSTNSDSIFVSNGDIMAVIVHTSYLEVETIYVYNDYYSEDLEYFGRAELYNNGSKFVECEE